MTFYVVDRDDPSIKAYPKAFPTLFTTRPVPAAFRPHLRYPEDLFRVQADMYGLYHITDPSDFYDKGDAWDIARDPGGGSVAQTRTTTAGGTTAATSVPTKSSTDDRMDPYYLLMRLPNEQNES